MPPPIPAPPPAEDSPYDFPPLDPFIFTIYASSSFHSSAHAFALLLLLCPISRVGQTVYFLFFLFHCSAFVPNCNP